MKSYELLVSYNTDSVETMLATDKLIEAACAPYERCASGASLTMPIGRDLQFSIPAFLSDAEFAALEDKLMLIDKHILVDMEAWEDDEETV